MISMNIRSTTVAIATPDELRGRVLAVEMVFISASNELGAFESGRRGGAARRRAGRRRRRRASTIGLAAVWTLRSSPRSPRIDRLEDLRPALP